MWKSAKSWKVLKRGPGKYWHHDFGNIATHLESFGAMIHDMESICTWSWRLMTKTWKVFVLDSTWKGTCSTLVHTLKLKLLSYQLLRWFNNVTWTLYSLTALSFCWSFCSIHTSEVVTWWMVWRSRSQVWLLWFTSFHLSVLTHFFSLPRRLNEIKLLTVLYEETMSKVVLLVLLKSALNHIAYLILPPYQIPKIVLIWPFCAGRVSPGSQPTACEGINSTAWDLNSPLDNLELNEWRSRPFTMYPVITSAELSDVTCCF